jgi:hypothetical protein
METTLVKCIFGLVRGFDDDEGVPRAIYEATDDLIELVFGKNASESFDMSITSNDQGRFFIRDEKNLDLDWILQKLTEDIKTSLDNTKWTVIIGYQIRPTTFLYGGSFLWNGLECWLGSLFWLCSG